MRSPRSRHKSLGLCLALAASPAFAQPPQPAPLRTNDYTIDLYQGPVLASSRVVGLAGAFVAMADGIDGDTQNPASPAVRVPYSYTDIDYDLGAGLSFPGSLGRSGDFFNSGSRTRVIAGNNLYVFLNGAFNLQINHWGFGVTADLQQYSLQRNEPGATQNPRSLLDLTGTTTSLTGQIMQNHLLASYAFDDGQLVVGTGARVVTLDVSTRATFLSSGVDTLNTRGAGVELGFIWRPNGERVRVGGAFRSTVNADTQGGVIYRGTSDELWLPNHLTLPWDLSFGAAVQLGRKPLNPRWVSPAELLAHKRRYLAWQARERERRTREALADARREGRDVITLERILRAADAAEAALDRAELERAERAVDRELRRRNAEMPRFHVLLTSSFLMTGAVHDGVGIEGFLNREDQRSGQQISLSPRLGVEVEPIPNWLQARAGVYFEPTRFRSNEDGGRSHVTFGGQARLLPWDVFGTFPEGSWWWLGGSLDVARNYLGWGLALGVWH
ncbi:MAG TPA: hypothetical protein VMI54_24215 [Polyangiaceae bacterium]|nr:hypothetical protein [Polyangiaceae bacterium]